MANKPDEVGANLPAHDYQEHSFTNKTDIGTMNVQCLKCNAENFAAESDHYCCCCAGKLTLPLCPPPPAYLLSLMQNNPDSNNFLENIRLYNSLLQITSLGCHQQCLAGSNPTFTVQGHVFHRIGSLFSPGE